jgi:hypothetical protein
MESIIKLDDVKVNTWEMGKVRAEVKNADGVPLNGRAIVKINHISRIQGYVVNGIFEEEHDFSDLYDDEYDLYMIYGGTEHSDPADATAKLYLNHDKTIEVPIFDLQNACYRLTKWIDVNKKLPGKIAIKKEQVSVANLLYALANCVKKINDEDPSDVMITKVNPPKVSSENIKEDIQLTKDEYIQIANEIITTMDDSKNSPAFIEVNGEKLGFMNLIYTFCKIVQNSSENGLISTVYVRPWKEIVAK